MQRTQISLTDAERRLLDAESERTGRSMAALIREAILARYGSSRSTEGDLVAMRGAFGAWPDRGEDGAEFVERLRSGDRLGGRT